MSIDGDNSNDPLRPADALPIGLEELPLEEPGRLYHTGTLSYTKAGLFVLFSWLLWGDFCLTLFEQMGGTDILTLYLQNSFRVSNFKTSVLLIAIPQSIGMIVGPMLSFKSDRHRGPRGRRIPFIIYTTPFLCLFAAGLGCCDGVVKFMKDHIGDGALISPMTASMLAIAFLVAGFTFFNDFVTTVFSYLYVDVVPRELMGRFLALFRMIGAAAGWLVNYVVGPHALSHMFLIHVGVAVVYLFGFSLVCWNVREGQYPPVTDVTKQTRFVEKVGLYFTQSFRKRIYVLVYISSFWWMFARSTGGSPLFGFHLSQHIAQSDAHTQGNAHTGEVRALAMTPGGKVMLSVGADGKALLWDGSKPQPLPQPLWDAVRRAKVKETGKLQNGGPAILAAALTRDGRLAFTGDAAANMWRVDTHTETTLSAAPAPASAPASAAASAPASKAAVMALAVSSDGARLASGDADGTLRLWNVLSGACLHSIAAHSGAIRAVTFSSDGRRVATGGIDAQIHVYNAATGTLVNQLKTPGAIYALAFAPSLGPGRPPKPLPLAQRALSAFTNYFHDVFSNESLYTLPVDQRSTELAADAWLLSGGQDGGGDNKNAKLRIWDAASGALVMELVGHKQAITSVQYKPDLHVVLSGSLDDSIRMWDPADWAPINPSAENALATDQSLRSYVGYTGPVTAIAAPDAGKTFASASSDGGIHLWDLDAGVSLKRSRRMTAFFLVFVFLIYYPCGALVDHWHPIPLTFWASLVVLPAPIYYYFFQYDYLASPLAECIKVPMYTLIGAAQVPLLMAIFPKSQFGQLASAHAFFRQATSLVFGLATAALMDVITKSTLLTDNFRYGNIFQLIGFIGFQVTLFYIYRHWVRAGRPKALHDDL